MANEYIRKEWAGGVVRSTLTAGINASATTFSVVDGSSFPSGVKPFVLVIDRGTATEEKLIITSRTGNSFTVLQRGYDGSSGQTHAAGAYVEHVLDAYTVDQANAIASTMTTQGDILYKTVTGDNTSFGRLGVGTSGYPIVSAGTAPAYQQLGSTGIGSTAVTAAKINADVAGLGLVKNGVSGALDVNPDGSTLEINADQVRVKDGGITSAKIGTGAILDTNINAGAAIAYSKLAALPSGNLLVGNASNVAQVRAITGDITIDNTGLTSIAAGAIVAGDFAAGAKPIVICTSTTRPTGIVEGQVIYETDKDRLMVYDGAAWQYISGVVGATVSGSAAIPNANTFNLAYSTETLDTDTIIPASGNTFTVPFTGLYSLTIDVTAPTDMNAGLGSNLILTAGTRVMDARLFSTSAAVTLIVPLTASQTAKFQITNGTGASLTYSYETILRLIGQ